MFRFEDPIYLYLLIVIPLLAIVRFMGIRSRKRKLKKFGDIHLLKELMPDVSRWRPEIKFWLLIVSLSLLIIALARPQMGTKISNEKRIGIETIIAMDISNSMLAQDVAPCRLDRSKMLVENLVEHFTDDKIGLIVFAGDAFVQLPITSDYVSAKMFLGSINPSLINTQGTDIATAINLAMHSFTQQEGIGKAIIIITDGENHEGGAVEAAEAARKAGFRIYVLGVGSTKGSPIPVPGTSDYMTDNTGNTVMSALNEEMCREVAQAGGGAFIHVENNSAAQDQLDSELDKLAKKETETTIYSDYDEQFMAFAILAILLLVIEVCILDIKNPMMKHLSLFKRKKYGLILLALCLSSLSVNAQNDRSLIRHGNKEFRAGNYANAEVDYRKALEKNPKNSQALFNLGNTLFAQRKDSAAIQNYENATNIETNPKRKAMAYHNIGVVCQNHKMYGEAIEAYKNALRLNPHDDQTRYNLELCKRQKQKQDQQNKENQKQQNKDDKNKDKNKDKKENQKKDKDQQQQKEKDKDQPQNKPKMSKENAEQLLNAAMQQEKATQQKMKEAQRQQGRRRLEKNW